MDKVLKNKKILLGVTGSIAAYKTPLLVRELIKRDAHVQVIMSPSAKNFVTSTVLSNLSGNPVIIEMFDNSVQDMSAWHIQYAHWCDLMIIAPCSASTLSRIANGLCDTALATTAIALPRTTPLLISPAMDFTMWEHPTTQRNVEYLKEIGTIIIPPEDGELASGLSGPGRMPEINVLVDKLSETLLNSKTKNSKEAKVENKVNKKEEDSLNADIDLEIMKLNKAFLDDIGTSLKNKKVLITAGPTYEKIDDVRFIGNYSSGKMGFALAEEASIAGANVTLVSGPVSLQTPKGVNRIDIHSAKEMFDKTVGKFNDADIAILAAAVADYTPKEKTSGKLKKEDIGEELKLELTTTDDILHTLGLEKKPGQILIGFALESSNVISNGWKKLKSKNCNMIVVNTANRERSGFGGDENTISLLMRDGTHLNFEPMSKKLCAQEIIKKINDL